MHRFNKALSIGLATLMTCGSLPVFASATSAFKSEGEYKYQDSIGSVSSDFTDNGTSVGKDTTQGKESATKHPFVDSSSTTIDATLEQTEVFATVAPAYGIKIPKTLILSASGLGLYDIGVSGDLTGTQKLTIRPVDKIENTDDIDFYMAEQGAFIGAKDDIVAKVDQTKTTWTYSEMKKGEYTWLEEAGKITADDISAGSWAGTFDFLIGMNTFEVSDSEYFTLYAPSVDPESNMSAGSDGTWVEVGSNGDSANVEVNQIGEWEKEEDIVEFLGYTGSSAGDSMEATMLNMYGPIIEFAESTSISTYAALILVMMEVTEDPDMIAIAQQGDAALDEFLAPMLEEEGVASMDEFFLGIFGMTAHEFANELEKVSKYELYTSNSKSTAFSLTSDKAIEIELKIYLKDKANITLGFTSNTKTQRSKEAAEFLYMVEFYKEPYKNAFDMGYSLEEALMIDFQNQYTNGSISFAEWINTPFDQFEDHDWSYTFPVWHQQETGYKFTLKDIINYVDNGINPECLYSEELIKDLYNKDGEIISQIDYNFLLTAITDDDDIVVHSNNKSILTGYEINEDSDGYCITVKVKLQAGPQTLYVDTFKNVNATDEEARVGLLFTENFDTQQTEVEFIPGDDIAGGESTWEDIDGAYLAIAPEYNYYTEDSFKEFLSTGDESVLVENTSRKQLPKDLVLPSELYGYQITGLVPYALRGYEEVEYVYVPQTYTELDATALSNTNIKEIVIRNGGLITVNASVFDNNTELEIITLPEAIVTIPSFTGCPKLKEVTTN